MGVFALEFTCFFPACDRCDSKKTQLLWVIRAHMYAHIGSQNAQTKMHKRKAGNERRDAHMNLRCTRERQERSIQYRHTSAHLTCRHNISEERRDFSALFRVFLSLWGKWRGICIESNRKVRGANEMVFWIAREVFSRKTTCISGFFRIFAYLIPMGKKD